jgi:hypothetical protein
MPVAVRRMGVLTGLRIERSERGQPGGFTELTNEQLVAELRELGITVEMDAPRSHGMN